MHAQLVDGVVHCQVGRRTEADTTNARRRHPWATLPHSRRWRHAVPMRIVCPIGGETSTTTRHRDANTPLHVGVAESVQSADAEHVVTTAAVATMVLVVKRIFEGHRSRFIHWSRGHARRECRPCSCRRWLASSMVGKMVVPLNSWKVIS